MMLRRRFNFFSLAASAFIFGLTGRAAETNDPLQNLVPLVNPMCGTGGKANTFPGAVAPFGMIQWSPDTEMGLREGGYSDQDTRISDFSLDHISGAGCNYGEDFAMLPLAGEMPAAPPADRIAFAATFSHTNEIARAGYYSVLLDNGIRTELTTTLRTGFGRFTYAAATNATLMINAASDINGSDASGIVLNPNGREVSGWSTGGYFCHARDRSRDVRTVYFYAIFNRPFAKWSTWSDHALTAGGTNATAISTGAFITFDTSTNRMVLVKVGLSYVSVANAKANVESENPAAKFSTDDFDRAVATAGDAWNLRLNKIQITGGTLEQRQTFYSMLYHAMLAPSVVSDSNGEYTGYDGAVHHAADGRAQYGIFSGWDIYRSECQLLAMIAPREASDMAQSLLLDYQQGGAFPRWGAATEDSGVMIGDPSAPMLAAFYAFGATHFDAQTALAGLIDAATNSSVHAARTQTNERDALEEYLQLGYVPEHPSGGYGNVSMTLEYSAADFALAQFARALGDETHYATLLKQSQNWRNLFNPATGYLQMRQRDGSWSPNFTNRAQRYDDDRAYVEGTASQYVWMVPFDLQTLATLMGGTDAATKRLDIFFTKLNGGFVSPYAFLGNEPSFAAPWEYDFFSQPYKTQKIVRRAVNELFASTDQAYPGNDDVGEMSSWYIFAALGMYPELPGSDVLVLGSPLFPKTVLHFATGNATIIANHAGKNVAYIQSLQLNGQAWNQPWIRFADISHGGQLTYNLSLIPDKTWGADPAQAPPSDNKK